MNSLYLHTAIKALFLFVFFTFSRNSCAFAQVSINTSGASPRGDALLDINGDGDGADSSVVITKDGKIGIGTIAPSTPLHIKSESSDISFRYELDVTPAEGPVVNNGPRPGQTLVNDAGAGSKVWSDAASSASSDNSYAKAVSLSGSSTSQYLKITNFGFAIPDGHAIKGVTVKVEKSKADAPPPPTILNTWVSSTNTGSSASYNLTRTVSAGNDRLLVAVGFRSNYSGSGNLTLSSVTYGGQALTKAEAVANTSGNRSNLEIWYLNEEGIAAASNTTLTYTWTGTAEGMIMAAGVYQEIDQSNPIRDSHSNGTNSFVSSYQLSSSVSSNAGDFVIYAGGLEDNHSSSPSAGFTELVDRNTTDGPDAGLGVNHKSSSGGTDQPSSSFSGADPHAIAAIVLAWSGNGTPTAGTASDLSVQLVKEGSVGGTNKAVGGNWGSTDVISTYGGAADLWGNTFNVTDINASDFGVAIRANTNGAYAQIDNVTVTVHHAFTPDATTNYTFGTDADDGSSFKISAGSSLGSNDVLTLSPSGAVGIGTSAPLNTLDVAGGVSIGSGFAGASNAPTNGLAIEGALGLGTSTPNTSAILDMSSTSKGVLLPRMTLTERDAISNPASGLMVWVTDADTNGVYVNLGTTGSPNWDRMIASSELPSTNVAGEEEDPYAEQKEFLESGLLGEVAGVLAGVTDGEFYYMADTNDARIQWAPNNDEIIAAQSQTDGLANMAAIIAYHGAGNYCAYKCDTLSLLGYEDWYLPAENQGAPIRVLFNNIYPQHQQLWEPSSTCAGYGSFVTEDDIRVIHDDGTTSGAHQKIHLYPCRCYRKYTP